MVAGRHLHASHFDLGLLLFRPKTGRDWLAFGAFTAFLAALFIEMYVFPLTIYLLSVAGH